MSKVKVLVRDKSTLVLDQDANKGDIILLNELSEIDYSDIEQLIEQGKDSVYERKLLEYKELLNLKHQKDIIEHEKLLNDKITSLLNQIETIKNDNVHSLKNKEYEVEKKYLDLINSLNSQISSFKVEIESLKNNVSLQIEKEKLLLVSKYEKQLNEKEGRINSINQENKLLLEKKELEYKLAQDKIVNELINKHEVELREKDNAINALTRQKASMNVKQTGEDLELWCNNEVTSYMQNGLFNCTWTKDNEVKKLDGETKGSKADYIFKIYANDKLNEEELISSICLDMKDENPDSTIKKTNADHYKQLDNNRNKKNCKYAVLVSNLEMDKSNYLPMFKVKEYPDMYVVRPAYLMSFLNIMASLSTRFSTLILKDNEEKLEYKNITDLFEQFDVLKNTYLDKPLQALEKQINDISTNNNAILKAALKIEDVCKKISEGYLAEINEKLNKFEIKITKEYKKVK